MKTIIELSLATSLIMNEEQGYHNHRRSQALKYVTDLGVIFRERRKITFCGVKSNFYHERLDHVTFRTLRCMMRSRVPAQTVFFFWSFRHKIGIRCGFISHTVVTNALCISSKRRKEITCKLLPHLPFNTGRRRL